MNNDTIAIDANTGTIKYAIRDLRDDDFVRTIRTFGGFGYTRVLEDAQLFADAAEAGNAIKVRNASIYPGSFAIVPVVVQTTPEKVTETINVVEGAGGWGWRMVDGDVQYRVGYNARWIVTRTLTPGNTGGYKAADYRALAEIHERPTIRTVVPGTTTVTLL